jgi:hypothetical protein
MLVGAVTVIAPHPEFTAGAGGAGGKMTTFTVLLAVQVVPVAPALVLPQAVVNIYLARIG